MSRMHQRLFLTLALAGLLAACVEEEGEETNSCATAGTVTCQNGGTPTGSAGSCTCACTDGYQGASCETARNAAFLGTWTAVDNCSRSAMNTYDVVITPQTGNPAGVRIGNFWNIFNNPVLATVESDGRLMVAEQEPDMDEYFVSGSATLNGNTLSFAFAVESRDVSSPATDQCTGMWTRQP